MLALLYVTHMYSADFVAGKVAMFMQGDAAQHVSGWMFFRDDDWRFPLLLTQRLNAPEGVSIAFTDSIPLLALPLKLLRAWLPPDFHYFGLWHVAIYLLQAVAAVYLMRALGARTVFAALIAAGFALSWPALLMRFGHTSLLTHALILFALGVYFRARDERLSLHAAGWRFVLIIGLAMMVHPYLMAMCYAVFAAHLADQSLTRRAWKSSVFFLWISLMVVALLAVVLGYVGGALQTAGFGLYSLNLTSPFCGGRLWHCINDGTGGQGFEGYNYFGAGFLVLCVLMLWRCRISARAIFTSYPALTAMAVTLVVYALSNRIFVSSHLLFEYPLPGLVQMVANTFRCSGRFFWVVGYLMLFVVLARVVTLPQAYAKVLIVAALLLQLYDTNEVRDRVRHDVNKPAPAADVDWPALLKDVDMLALYPVYGCDDSYQDFQLHYQAIAAHNGKPINTGYVARAANLCHDKHAPFEAFFSARTLYVVPADRVGGIQHLPAGFARAIARQECVAFGRDMLCLPGQSAATLAQRHTKLVPLTSISRTPALQLAPLFLPTVIGRREGNTLIAPGGVDGFLSFGPYRSIAAGKYSVAITLDSAQCRNAVVGYWDAVGDSGTTQLARGDLRIATGQTVVEGFFVAYAQVNRLEIRTYSSGACEFRLRDITLSKQD